MGARAASRAQMLWATYSVEFEDRVMGGIAIQGFSKTLRLGFGFRRVELMVQDQTLRFRRRAVVDAVLTASVSRMRPALCEAS